MINFENLKTILKKTDKGIDALKVRGLTLSHKSRVLLILIDGKKTLAEIVPFITTDSESLTRIKELFDTGFATEVMNEDGSSNAVNLQEKATQNTAQSSAIKETQSLQVAIRSATKLLTDMLGPNSDVLCMQLEKCKTKDEFNTKILAFRKIVGTMRSEKLGDEFVKAAIS